MTDADFQMLREELRQKGSLIIRQPDGKMFFLIASGLLGMAEKGVLITGEGQGGMFYPLDRQMNQFRLVQAGFSIKVAPTLSEIVNGIFWPGSQPETKTARVLLAGQPITGQTTTEQITDEKED